MKTATQGGGVGQGSEEWHIRVHDLATAFGVSPATIRTWCIKGQLPRAERSAVGWRYWREDQVKAIVGRVAALLAKRKGVELDANDIREELLKQWKRYAS